MNRSRETGFTLVELMVVIVLIGLLAGVVSVKVVPLIFKGKTTTAKNQMKEISSAIELFYLSQSHYPEELSELTQDYPDHPGGFLDEIPRDPWGENYVYLPESARSGSGFQIYSKGEDRLDGTEDDVTLKQNKE